MALDPKKHEMPTQEPSVRAHNFKEVALGYTEEIALAEAARCLNCKNRPCVQGCPVNISIPEFIAQVKVGNYEEAIAQFEKVLSVTSDTDLGVDVGELTDEQLDEINITLADTDWTIHVSELRPIRNRLAEILKIEL